MLMNFSINADLNCYLSICVLKTNKYLISNQVNIWKEIASFGAGIIDEDTVQGTFQSLEKFLSMSKADSNEMKLQSVFAYKQFFDVTKTAGNLLEAIN